MPKVIDNMGKVLAEFPYDASGEMEAQKMVTGNPNLKVVKEEVQGGVPVGNAMNRGAAPAVSDFSGLGQAPGTDPGTGDDDIVPPHPIDPREQQPGSTYKKGGKVKLPFKKDRY